MLAAHPATRSDERPQPGELRIAELMDEIRPRALWLIGHYRIPPQDADDLLQQTFLAFLYKHADVRDPEAWLLGTLRHKCLRYWRKRKRQAFDPVEEGLLEEALGPEATAQELVDLRHDLELALARLPERCRRILRHRYALGYRATEIAEILGFRPATVRKISSRCLRALGRELRQRRRG